MYEGIKIKSGKGNISSERNTRLCIITREIRKKKRSDNNKEKVFFRYENINTSQF